MKIMCKIRDGLNGSENVRPIDIDMSTMKEYIDRLLAEFCKLLGDDLQQGVDIEGFRSKLHRLCDELRTLTNKFEAGGGSDEIRLITKSLSDDLFVAWTASRLKLTSDGFLKNVDRLPDIMEGLIEYVRKSDANNGIFTTNEFRKKMLGMSLAEDEIESTKQLVAMDCLVDGAMETMTVGDDGNEDLVMDAFDSIVEKHEQMVEEGKTCLSCPVHDVLDKYFHIDEFPELVHEHVVHAQTAFSTWLVICLSVLIASTAKDGK